MKAPSHLSVLAASALAVAMLSGCTGDGGDNASPSADTTTTASPSPTVSTATPSATATASPEPTATAVPPSSEPPASSTSAPPPNKELDASVFVTLATRDPATGGLMVGGYVEGLVEDDGDCSYLIRRKGGADLNAHTTGVANVDTTSCGSTVVPASQTPAGTYTVILTYVNGKGSASSEPFTVEIS